MMTFSMKRFSAIVRKEMYDAGKNSQILIMALFPIIMALFYGNMDTDKGFIASFTIAMALTMIGSFVQAIIIAEEKEKNTLRVLMLSPANPLEVIFGKSVLTIFFVIVSSFISLLILGVLKGNIGMLIVILLVGTLLCIILGTIVGLLSQNIAQTSVIGMPIFILFSFGPMLQAFVKNEVVIKAVRLLPTTHIVEGLNKALHGKGFFAIQGHLINNAIWMVALMIICIFVYKKKQLD